MPSRSSKQLTKRSACLPPSATPHSSHFRRYPQLKREAFERAIHSDSPAEKPVADQLDLDHMAVESSYMGPHPTFPLSHPMALEIAEVRSRSKPLSQISSDHCHAPYPRCCSISKHKSSCTASMCFKYWSHSKDNSRLCLLLLTWRFQRVHTSTSAATPMVNSTIC